jgi:hypothetical protein
MGAKAIDVLLAGDSHSEPSMCCQYYAYTYV